MAYSSDADSIINSMGISSSHLTPFSSRLFCDKESAINYYVSYKPRAQRIQTATNSNFSAKARVQYSWESKFSGQRHYSSSNSLGVTLSLPSPLFLSAGIV